MTLARKSLDELFAAGKEYNIAPDGADEPFMVFIRKLGPTQQNVAARKSNSARTTLVLDARDPESDYNKLLKAQVEGIEREDKIRQLAMTEIAEDREKLEQEISGNEEWSKDGYLQSLVDAWEGGLQVDWHMGEDLRSEESVRVFGEMKRFADEVDKKLESRLQREINILEQESDETIDEKMMNAQIEFDASAEWLKTFRMYQILFGVRDIESNQQIYERFQDVEDIPAELFAKLIAAVVDLNVPITQVKS